MTAAESSARQVVTDIDLLNRKHKEVGRLKVQRAALVIIVVLLALAIGTIAVVSRFSPPQAQPNIDVLTREEFGEDKSTIRIPATYAPGQERPTVTAGVPFQYNTRGEKLLSVDGVVAYQLNCEVNGAPSRNPLGEVYINTPKGKYNVTATYTIPISSRIVSSDACRLQTIVTYTFYQTDSAGNTRPIEVTEIGISNVFRLEVPEEENEAAANPSNRSVAQAPASTPATPQAVAPPEAQPQDPPTDPPETPTIPERPTAPAQRPNGLVPGLLYDLTHLDLNPFN